MAWLPETVGQRIVFAITLVYGSFRAWGISDFLTWLVVMALLPNVARKVIMDPEWAANWVARVLLIPSQSYDAVATWFTDAAARLSATGPLPWDQPPEPVPGFWPFHDWDPLLQREPEQQEFPVPRGHREEDVAHCACLDKRAEALELELLRHRVAFLDIQDKAREAQAELQEEINLRRNTPRNGFVQQREAYARIAALEVDLARTRTELAQARALIRQHLQGQGHPGQD